MQNSIMEARMSQIITDRPTARQLERMADDFLRKHRIRRDGLPYNSVDPAQRRFERSSCVKSPTGGQRWSKPR